jgi:hypothetical protein
VTTSTHHAHTIPCPGCHALPGRPCTTLRGKPLDNPHPRRAAQWARQTACCPECQVTPGTECRTTNGWPMPFHAVHARRYQEAEATTP